MPQSGPSSSGPVSVVRLSDLRTRPMSFLLEPDASTLRQLAETLDLIDLRKVRFEGELAPQGATDWALSAHLGATVVQPCRVTLAPVTTRLEETVERRYLATISDPTEAEAEMPEDDSAEPLPATLDLAEVMTEALSLALPAFPRAEGAELETAVFTEPGKPAMTDEDARPFAGLAALKNALKQEDNDPE